MACIREEERVRGLGMMAAAPGLQTSQTSAFNKAIAHLEGHDCADDEPSGEGPQLDKDSQDGEDRYRLDGGGPKVMDLLDAVVELLDVGGNEGDTVGGGFLGDGGHGERLAADGVDKGGPDLDANFHAAERHALEGDAKDVGINEVESGKDPALVLRDELTGGGEGGRGQTTTIGD